MMSVPKTTTALIVGAGPAGLACAISLFKHGCRDIAVVDQLLQGENTSRAVNIHAATVEALDSIGCAESLLQQGIKGKNMTVRNRSGPLITLDFGCLAPYTRFPFGLIIPQSTTERILAEHAQQLGVPIFRPYKVTAIKKNNRADNTVDVCCESGEVIRTKYIVGADGAKSAVRQIAGLNFADPDGLKEDDINALSQVVLADVEFQDLPDIPLPTGVVSSDNFFLVMPLPPTSSSSTPVYRIGGGVPVSYGSPPHAPPTSYLQTLLDKYGPLVNSSSLQISKTHWSTRFRTHSAIADRVFVRFDGQSIIQAKGVSRDAKGAAVVLVGDAAHIHSPAGGQGMNLGLRDSIALGPVLAVHMNRALSPGTDTDNILEEYASIRHARAQTVIRMTKTILGTVGGSGAPNFFTKYMWWFPVNAGTMRDWAMRILGRFGVVKRTIAWRLSGLGMR